MTIIKKTAHLQAWLQTCRNSHHTVGFVPTMGALHPGHLSLLEAAKPDNTVCIASIFVNPAQFNDKKDFEKYPVTLEQDIELLVTAGCDAVFIPAVAEMYPDGWQLPVHYDLGFLENTLEGQYRPGHFQGVCRVMQRLLELVQPSNLYMGQKDYQQCMVVNRLLSIMQSSTRLHTCPTLRHTDGLAMSSRNMRLTVEERKNATGIYGALSFIKNNLRAGSTGPLLQEALQILARHHFRTDYIVIADAQTLEPVVQWNGQQALVALVAAFQNEVRLIDNLLLN